MDKANGLLILAMTLFTIGLTGVIIRKNMLIILMSAELMLNGVNLSLVIFAQMQEVVAGAVLVFMAFVVAAAEIAVAIPIVLLLFQKKNSLDINEYSDLKG